MDIITSLENKLIKELLALQIKKQRHKIGKFLLESKRSIEEALIYGSIPEIIVLRENTELPDFLENYSQIAVKVSDKVFMKISTTENSQGIIGVYKFFNIKINNLLDKNKLLFLDGIQDPGNLGTIIRSAAAFNIGGILVGPGSVDIYNEKVLRSTLGGIFALPIIEIKTEELKLFKKHGFNIIGAKLDGENLYNYNFKEKVIVGIGNENSGLSNDFMNVVDDFVTIQISRKMESLNASVAASIILYELNRI
jgi:RNA methyltransferase, TrmH family